MAARLDPPAPERALRSVPVAVALWLFFFALAVVLCACGDARADADAIHSLVIREVAAINAKDLRALSEIWSHDNNILLFDVPPPGRFRGWEQIGRLWKEFFDRVTDIHLTVDEVQAEAQGSLGYATYDWAMTGRLGSYPLEDRGQATAIYHKERGSWKLIHAHYSPVPPALAGQEAPAGGTSPARGATALASPSPRPNVSVPAGSPAPRPGAAVPYASPQPGAPTPTGTASPAPSASPAGAVNPPPAVPRPSPRPG
jgi:ketosteroid isomerase-like protein